MKKLFLILIITSTVFVVGCNTDSVTNEIVIENEQTRLIITNDGIVKSLIHKPTNEECLVIDQNLPAFSVTQYHPYTNEIRLAYPFKETEFAADSVRREGDKLIVSFKLVDFEAVIDLNITSQYIQFRIENFVSENGNNPPQVDEMCFLQLPVRNRSHFGDWLNVAWDDQMAINLLATDHYARIDSEEREGFRILKADMVSEVKKEGVGAALITSPTGQLLDHIARVEEDYNLPRGVKNRRNEQYNASYYWSGNVHPGNVDQHIDYAHQAGFQTFMVYYTAFSESPGHFPWHEEYPNGMEDLQKVVNKIREAGLTPGLHFHYNKAGKSDPYVTPKPDHRLNIRRHFTLYSPVGRQDTTIFTEENPEGTTLADGRRILQIGNELISYSDYTTTPPYKFTGCSRGALNTTAEAHPLKHKFGLLDVDSWPKFVRFNQSTDIQEEVAEKIAEIYQKAGFQFVYFDGAEDVHPPYWFTCSKAQWEVYKQLQPEPIFAEGAAKSHFSWHMLSRANAFDTFRPEVIKEMTRKHPAAEAPMMKENFTGLNFGWLGYWVPGENTVGTQPDMLEYVTSRAAAWDCPVSIQSSLERFDGHPRTSDNLEVLRRWEQVREKDWLTEEQKEELQNLNQEHTLLINEQDTFELVPYNRIMDVANGSREVRAFTFRRNGDVYAVYWHISGNKKIKLPISPQNITLLEGMGKEISIIDGDKKASVTLPAGKRRFIKTSETKSELIAAFEKAEILP
ncbi:MAG: hypothetical protein V5A51_12665 [Bacteroidales bacterium]|nr:hypothetical protein [Bacteroidales bacterium]